MINEIDRAEDLYADGMAQVRMDTWSMGRVALVGDAASCRSPLTGQSTGLALVGAYVLARVLAGSIGHEAALARYEKRLRPFVVANRDIDIRHVRKACSRKTRSVRREVRWRWTLKVFRTGA
jgi:2-polyprenyl-6-methoxyphenol hydroxylase-like FAD-dependent oxidoreductase